MVMIEPQNHRDNFLIFSNLAAWIIDGDGFCKSIQKSYNLQLACV